MNEGIFLASMEGVIRLSFLSLANCAIVASKFGESVVMGHSMVDSKNVRTQMKGLSVHRRTSLYA